MSDQDPDDLDLDRLDEQYARASAADTEWDPVPDGSYMVRVDDVSFARAKTTDNPMLKWRLRIMDGPLANRILWRNNMLLTDENFEWLKHDLKVYGVEAPRMRDVQTNIPQLRGILLAISKKTSGAFENIYFRRRVERNGSGASNV